MHSEELCRINAHNRKTGNFTSWKERERLRNFQKLKLHVQSVQNYCFSLQKFGFMKRVDKGKLTFRALALRRTKG